MLSRNYNLYSNIQRADDIVIFLPTYAGEKYFQVKNKITFIALRITQKIDKIDNRRFTNYIMLVDDMVKA